MSQTEDRNREANVGEDVPMIPEQAAQLKQLAHATFDLEAFDSQLSRAEAQRRIVTLRAKLKLQGEPPHTL
jgi:hypothetical protein